MAQTDGSIILDTQLDSEGFKAGSEELLKALRSLTAEIQGLGKVLTNLFEKPLTPQVDTKPAEQDVAALEAKIRELEAAMAEAKGQGGAAAAPTAETAPANTGTPTQEYEALCAELDKVGAKFDTLMGKQEKMQALGVSQESMQWRSLQYDMEAVSNQYQELLARKQELEASGGAYQAPAVDPTPYDQVEADLSSAAASSGQINEAAQQAGSGMDQMAADTQETASGAAAAARTFTGQLGAGIKSAVSGIGSMAKQLGGKVVSGIKAAASGMAQVFRHSRATNGQFGGLISGAKKFALSLLGARGIWALLRKAVSAYMAENQQLSNTLSSCWSSIGNLLGPIITKVINLVATATSYVTAFLKLFGLYGKTATKQISAAGGAASKAVNRLLASFDELNILSRNQSGGSGSNSENVELPEVEVPDWAKLIAEQIKGGDWTGLASTLSAQIRKVLQSITGAINGFDWGAIGQKVAAFLNGIDWDGIFTDLAGLIGTLLVSALNLLSGFLTNVNWGGIATCIANGIGTALPQIVQTGGTILLTLVQGILLAIPQLLAAIPQIVSALLNGLLASIPLLIETGVQLFTSLVTALPEIIQQIVDVIPEIITAIIDALIEHLPDIVQAGIDLHIALIQGLPKILTTLASAQPKIILSIINALIQNIDKIAVAGVQLFVALIKNLPKIIIEIVKAVPRIIKGIVESISSFIPEMAKSGLNLIKGLWNGISDAGAWLWDKISGFFGGVVSKIKDFFGIHSPSRLFRDEVGLMLGYGIGEGVEDSQGEILKSVSGVAGAIAEEFNSGNYTIGGIVPTAEVDGTLDAFSDKISSSFTRLMDRLQAIADRVTFAVPNIATGSVAPYRTAAAANGGGLGELIASNDELSSVITQAVGSATERIVQALREQPTPVLNLDRAAMTDMVIREINRRTRSMGASPLLG